MVGQESIYVEEMSGLFWAEVDYIEDYLRIMAHRGQPSRLQSDIS